MVKAWLGLIIVAVVARAMLTGSTVDLGVPLMGWSAAVIAAGLGLGAFSKRVPSVFDAVVLAAAIAARGMIAAGCMSVFGSDTFGWAVAVVVSLGVPAVMLGRFASVWIRGRVLVAATAWALAEVLVIVGWTASWPGVATGPAVGLLAYLLTRGEHDNVDASIPEADDAPPVESDVGDVIAAGFIGASVTLTLLFVRRVLPNYEAPAIHATSEWIVLLLVIAAVIAGFISVLAGSPASWPARIARFAGGFGLAAALVILYDASLAYQNNGHIGITREFRYNARSLAVDLPMVQVWDFWATSFIGYVAAGLGVVLGALRGRAVAGFALGAATGFAAEAVVIPHEPVFGPAWLVLTAVGLAAWAGVVGVVGRWGLLAAPLVLAGFWLRDEPQRAGFHEMRRPGELSVEAHQRSTAVDTQLFSSPLLGTTSAEGTQTYLQTSIGRKPVFPVYVTSFEAFDAKVRRMEDEAKDEIERRYGVRVAGTTAHPGHPALGADGSVGRMLRMFGRPGDALFLGHTAELIALDWAMHEHAGRVDVVTPGADDAGTRISDYLLILADVTGTKGLAERVRPNAAVTFSAAERSYDLIVVAPERPEWPGAGVALTRERLAAAAASLTAGGRCLAWIDTMSLDAPSLRARLAAFGEVFGERGLVFVEPREQDAPFLLAVGWVDDAGDPRVDVLPGDASRPVELSGLRSAIRSRAELADHLILDGAGLVQLAQSAGAHQADRFVVPSRFAPDGWAAVSAVYDGEAAFDTTLNDGAPEVLGPLIDALTQHGSYSLHLEFVNQTVVEALGDVDWKAYDKEVAMLVAAAEMGPHHPIVHHALASLGEHLLVNGEVSRFADLYERVGGADLKSWRLELLKAAALDFQLEPELAADAMNDARELAGLEPLR